MFVEYLSQHRWYTPSVRDTKDPFPLKVTPDAARVIVGSPPPLTVILKFPDMPEMALVMVNAQFAVMDTTLFKYPPVQFHVDALDDTLRDECGSLASTSTDSQPIPVLDACWSTMYST